MAAVTASDRGHLRMTGVTRSVTDPLVVGIDLSLTSTGLASSDGWVSRVRSKPTTGTLLARDTRLTEIVGQILLTIEQGGLPDLVVIEAPAYSRNGGSSHDRSGLWWLLVHGLTTRTQVAEVPPTCRIKYGAGKGNAAKDEVMAAVIRRYPDFDVTGHDAADAVVLMAMGRDHLGCPLVAVPQLNRMGLAGVAWPPPLEGDR